MRLTCEYYLRCDRSSGLGDWVLWYNQYNAVGYAVWSDDEEAVECAMVHFGSATDPTDKSVIRVGVMASATTAEVAETWKGVAEVLLAERQGPSETQLSTAGKTVSVYVPYSWTNQSLRDPAFLQQICDTLRQVRSAFSSVTGLRS